MTENVKLSAGSVMKAKMVMTSESPLLMVDGGFIMLIEESYSCKIRGLVIQC